MPSQPNPDSPYLASRLQSVLGVRAPGTPSQAGSPDVQAGRVSFPAPPAPASAPVGRPPNPVAPAPATPVTTAPTLPFGASPPPAAAPATASANVPGAAALPPIAAVPPIGVPRGDGSLALTPEGDMRYRQAVVAGRAALGPVPRVFKHASLPELPYELGQRNWNPFTSSWSEPTPTDGMS